MGMLSGLLKGKTAKRVVHEARKPQTQARIRDVVSRFTGDSGRTTGGARGARTGRSTGRAGRAARVR